MLTCSWLYKDFRKLIQECVRTITSKLGSLVIVSTKLTVSKMCDEQCKAVLQ